MKNKYLISIIFVAVIVPQVTFAAWWNPMTWKVFKFLQKSEAPIEQIVSTTTETVGGGPNNQPSEIEQLKKEIEDLKKTQNSNATKSSPVAQPTKQVTTKSSLPVFPPTVSTPKFDAQLCAYIEDEHELLSKNLSDSISYLIKDLLPVFDNQIESMDYSQRYNNLHNARTSFFRQINEFKNKDIVRIDSSYLDQSYIQEIKDELTKLTDGYKDLWDIFTTDSLKLKGTNFYDSYDKNKAYDLIEKDYEQAKEVYEHVNTVMDLRKQMTDKYERVKVKNSCI